MGWWQISTVSPCVCHCLSLSWRNNIFGSGHAQFPWSQMSHGGRATLCESLRLCKRDFIHTSVPAHWEGATATRGDRNTRLSVPVFVEDRQIACSFTTTHHSLQVCRYITEVKVHQQTQMTKKAAKKSLSPVFVNHPSVAQNEKIYLLC